jgi:hypothetical protein
MASCYGVLVGLPVYFIVSGCSPGENIAIVEQNTGSNPRQSCCLCFFPAVQEGVKVCAMLGAVFMPVGSPCLLYFWIIPAITA